MSRRVIIDTDPGTDDAIALFLALASPEIEVALVTVAGGNVGLARTLANARALVSLAGADVPVVAGADRPLLGRFEDAAHVHGEDGLAGIALPEGRPAGPGVAADAIRAALRAAGPEGITLVGIGPATNLALALASEPALAANAAEIVLMTGAVTSGNVTPHAEFNAWSDPEALSVVLGCGRPVTLATLDLTRQAICTREWLASLPAGGRCLAAARAILGGVPMRTYPAGFGHPQHDACAIGWLVAPDLFTHVSARAEVDHAGETRGRTRFSPGEGPARLLEGLDPAAFFALLGERLASLP
jgi:inosine-uridine nucleoside N-ribohydrolase